MERVEYYTVHFRPDVEVVLKKLEAKYGLGNLYPMERPESLMGNAKILVLQDFERPSLRIKIDGPGFLIFEIYNKLMENYRRDEE